MTNDKIGEALRFDALSEAERVSGQSYKEDDATSKLGLAMHVMHIQNKERLLRESGDSYFSMRFWDHKNLYLGLGFSMVWREYFTGSGGDEIYAVFWHPEGLLATLESYGGERTNSAKMYYNYSHPDVYFDWKLKSSGHYNGDVWIGDHDAREGICYNLDALRAEGEFLPVWVERPWLSLMNYAEGRELDGLSYDERSQIYKQTTERKISELPEHVRRAITP